MNDDDEVLVAWLNKRGWRVTGDCLHTGTAGREVRAADLDMWAEHIGPDSYILHASDGRWWRLQPVRELVREWVIGL